MVDGEHINLSLWDTAGQSEYDRLRPLSYPQTDIFLCCFLVVGPGSFENARIKWISDIFHHSPRDVLVVLVGTKVDLRDDPHVTDESHHMSENAITEKMGTQLAKEVGAVAYLECSAATQVGIPELFDFCIRVVLKPPIQSDEKRKASQSKDAPVAREFAGTDGAPSCSSAITPCQNSAKVSRSGPKATSFDDVGLLPREAGQWSGNMSTEYSA